MHNATNHPFWSYSLTQYSQPSCEQFCLDAQNQFGLDVNMLLFSVWLGTQGKALDMTRLEQTSIQKMRQEIVSPIRTLRRSFKNNESLSAQEKTELYERLKVLELKAEQQQQWMLFEYAETLPTNRTANQSLSSENLESYLNSVGWNQEGKEKWIQSAIDQLYPYHH